MTQDIFSMVDFEQQAVAHGVGQFGNDKAHTFSIESFWALLSRGCVG
ncbi:MAG: hypothetical protein OXI36_04920 [Gammaproteobacteria bacterium]|nr:hypothetical protein [Gammaproteobacteria bacterium]MDE0402750.1 hypothetical protein [Gammaproteobacteria bacterium]